MKKEEENLKNLLEVYNEKNRISSNAPFPPLDVSEIVASIFSPGPFYFLITNFFDVRFEYVHHTIEEILGCERDTFNLINLIECMEPEDAEQMKFKEAAAAEFFFNRIPEEDLTAYKSSYTFRITDKKGTKKHILHQSLTLNVTEGRIHRSLAVHTDISHLKLLSTNRISFIGLNGRPSFYSLSTDPHKILEPQETLDISTREREIIKFLGEGMSSKQIADHLSISSHTVDTHRRNLLFRTGAKNTLELTVLCVKLGLV